MNKTSRLKRQRRGGASQLATGRSHSHDAKNGNGKRKPKPRNRNRESERDSIFRIRGY
jgi:hypothetical protein